ncbi:hypothetical protein PHYBLDRAFT_160931 [Phycomyces blakesleeanus NRRL 1555(-)]|uniref:Uncharacterized protein n=1 Tax=Phycomyces blakesleeanus (strain ATCC 8743b / DSM 1359 / FGSC 10004 / NBRC 33097 / NRRL 1555) TaxID=763407 RepID=A0A167QU93_PHYB8|nr:hypothetical protein PHYBLDRAFT_160931 [Phycomyces blakesleeanus NRRL 1555(-)]OAD80284.1 hypothetical protein PHYBLDRAFT_160931 [Phycomyces blakesleeanus NRRL 1555(-)]|eukprot:XP_018298324.1 hypothetical protein PHYBLDRAFT_160931 [Phycomyces blakesleeanus NRRL 1555(-)]
MFSLFSLFPTFIIFTDFLDTRVLLPSDASPSQCPSGLAKAISPKLLSTIKHGYEHDEPPSHEHIANQELSFHTSVIDMIGEVYGSKQYKKKSLRLDKINSNTTKPCKNWHIHKLNNDILQQNVILSCRFSACGKNPYTENANTSYYPAVLTFSYVRKLVLPPMTQLATVLPILPTGKILEFSTSSSCRAPQFLLQEMALCMCGSILPDQRPPPPLHSTGLPFASANSSFVSSVVEECMQFMPNRKAPGPDHIRAEMLKVIRPQIAPLLSLLFTICIFGPSVVTHHRSGALAAMATLTAVGACRSGFSLLLSSCLFKTFIQPKFEYGLAITCLLQKDVLLLEKIQDKCLRMIVGGHATSSTAVLKHICNLPSMAFRVDILKTKFCLWAHTLPSGCLLSLLHSHHLQASTLSTLHTNLLFARIPPDLNCSSRIKLSKHFESFRQEKFAHFHLTNTKILIQACRPLLEVDPVLFLSATHIERGRLVRWRMCWLPGKPKECACGFDHTSRRHLQFRITIPSQLFSQLSAPPTDEDNIIDFAISALPISSTHPSPLYWKALLTIL